jgi:ATP-dependent protease HslVU (ClpYQ) peptidase subunit
MTTIIGIQGDGYAILGTDTRINSIDDGGFASQSSTLGSGMSKISANGKYLIGAAGDVRAINILHHAFTPPPAPVGVRGKKLDQFITVKFIPALRACFDQHGYSPPEGKDNKEHIAEQNSTIVLMVNATIYVIDNDYSWMSDSTGIYAAGSGSSYALGAANALSAGKSISQTQAKTIVLKSLAVSAKLDPYTGAPYHTYMQTVQEKPSSAKK